MGRMNTRIFLPVVVFAVGFGVGYVLTWALVGSDSGAVADTVAVTALDDQGVTAGDDPAELPGNAKESPRAVSEPSESPTGQVAPEVRSPADVLPATSEVVVPPVEPATVGVPAVASPISPVAVAGERAVGEVKDDGVAAPAGGVAVPTEPASWWDTCKDSTCVVDWGGLDGGLSLRGGSIVHGDTVNWSSDFKRAKRYGVIPTDGKDTQLLVHAVAMAPDGSPGAADVTWSQAGDAIRGVIKLEVNGKRVTMAPK